MVPPLSSDTVFVALRTLSRPDSATTSEFTLKDSENFLLSWERSEPDIYVRALLQVILFPQDRFDAEVPRLAALLSLKAAIMRTWKDRGRGGRGRIIHRLLGEETKEAVRWSALSVVTGKDLQEGLAARLAGDRTLQVCLSCLRRHR